MRLKRILWLLSVATVLGVGGTWIVAQVYEAPVMMSQGGSQAYAAMNRYDVPYVPTPEPVVEKMLELAKVQKDDVVYDLGCGDGRIVITAARQFGARGVGVDIDPQRIKESNENARKAGVTDRVKFVQGNLFNVDLKEATVVTLYLLPEINLKLRPKLFRELKPGTRVVSHDFDMADWKPEKTVRLKVQRDHVLYYWTMSEKKDQPVFKEESPKEPSAAGARSSG
jgi:SAM-dependent methyltransferase